MFSDFAYKTYVCDYGLKFLDITLQDTPHLILQIASQKSYWKWWINEWNNWEREFLAFLQDNQPECSRKLYEDDMDALIGDHITEAGFENYMKLFKSGRI